MDTTVTEITNIPGQAGTQTTVKPKSTRGGWRPGGGRPRKVRPEKAPMAGSSLPALPATQGGVTKPIAFFNFWSGLSETELAQTIVYINRAYPLCDAKVKNPDAPKYIDKLVGPCPCLPGEWREWFLKTHGSGDYRIYFNEGSAQRLRVEIEGLRDYENYPPKIDWDTLMVNDKGNKDFVRWARTHGYAEEIRRLESGVTPEALERKEDEEMNAAIIQQNTELTGQLVDMAREVAAKPVQGPRETLAERSAMGMVEEAGKTANRMTEKAFELLATRTNDNTDPAAHTKMVIEMAETISRARSGDNTIVEMMREQITAQREEMRDLRQQLQTREAAAPAQAPRTLIEQLQEMALAKSLLKEALGDDSGDEKETSIKPGTPKAMLMDMVVKNGPQIIQASGHVLSSLFYGVSLLMRKAGDTSPIPPPPTAPPPPAINPQEKAEEDQLLFFLRMIEGSIKKHLNEWEQRDFPGADFADWLIDSQLDGRNSYDQLKSLPPDMLLMQLNQYAPLGAVIKASPDKFNIFLQQFLDHDNIREREKLEAEQDTEEDPEK